MKTLFYLLLVFSLNIFALGVKDLEHAKNYKNQNVDLWVMSEKLDGIRAFWNGKTLLSKNGKELHYPSSFIYNFPTFALDGELYISRQNFELTQSIIMSKSGSWDKITYNIFEVPFSDGNFYERLLKAKKWFKKHPSKYISFIDQIECKNTKHLLSYLDKLSKLGAEGVMVKNPNLPYQTSRVSSILKVKKAHDMEGLVVDINYKNEKFKSLVLKLDNGIVFNLGNGYTKEERLNHPHIGDIVTFKYYGFTKYKKPKFASFLRVRLK